MTAETIMTTLQALLQGSSDLSYIADSSILLGRRESITIFPSIFIVPISEPETNHAYPMERVTLNVSIVAITKVFAEDKHIVGSGDTKGIMDIKSDILNALDSDRKLSGACIHMNIRDKEYDTIENFPVVGVAINIGIEFEQMRGSR